MTEAEWFAATDRDILAAVLRLDPRRQRHLAVAACRLLGPLIDHPTAREALEAVEVFADTGKSKAALRRARQGVQATRDRLQGPGPGTTPPSDARHAAALFAVQVAATENAVAHTPADVADVLVRIAGEAPATAQARLFVPYSDIAGPAVRPPFPPAWRTEPVVALARGMYEARDFGPMPVLADALDDAGCADPDVLSHCRGDGPHARGCWVVDLILGRS